MANEVGRIKRKQSLNITDTNINNYWTSNHAVFMISVMKTTITTTIETRIPKQLLPLVDDAMLEYSKYYNHVKWCMFARKNRGENISKDKVAFCAEFNIPSRTFNAIKDEVDGMHKSQTSNMQRYIIEARAKICDAKDRILELESEILILESPSRAKERDLALIDKKYRAIRGKKQLIQRKEACVARWMHLLDQGKVSSCAGSRHLFFKQHNLHENGYRSHKEWLKDYRLKRNDEFYIKGSKDEACGNTLCRLTLDNDEFSLSLTLPNALQSKGFGKVITLNNLSFKYKPELLKTAIEDNKTRHRLGKGALSNAYLLDKHQMNISEMKATHANIIANMQRRGDDESTVMAALTAYENRVKKFSNPSKNNLLCDFGQAISYRFKRDHKGWRVIVSVTQSVTENHITGIKNGCIGIDLNEHHLAVTEVNAAGGKVCTNDLYFHKDKSHDNITSKQTKTALDHCIKEIIAKAIISKKPIAIENLDFKVSKAELKKGVNKSFNKTVSSMITAKFLNTLKARCIENGIELITVKAAYTSMIGRLKYASQFNFNIHAAAAMTIARRAMGKIDLSFPKQAIVIVRGTQMTFPVPEDSGKYDAFRYYKLVKSAYDKWFKFTYNLLRSNEKTLFQCNYDEDVFQ